MEWIGPFAWGLVIGYFWFPFWELVKKIVSEARKAKKEWRQPDEH